MSRIILIASMLLMAVICRAQVTTISGVVISEQDSIISFATIRLLSSPEGKLVKGTFTDVSGRFFLKVPSNKAYEIVCSYVGYAEQSRKFNAKNDSLILGRIQLLPAQHEAVVVTAKKYGVKISGDTTTFLLSSYLDDTEKSLEDVLAALPGFEINQDNRITYNGKSIDRILIDDQEMFLNHGVALTAIQRKSIKTIQILDNYDDGWKGNQKSGKVALNIKSDPDGQSINGSITAGLGSKNTHQGIGSAYSIKSKFKLSGYAQAKNVPGVLLSPEDYLAYSGALDDILNNNGTSLFIADGFPDFVVDRNDYVERNAQLIALNANFKTRKSSFVNFTNVYVDDKSTNVITEQQTILNNTDINTFRSATDSRGALILNRSSFKISPRLGQQLSIDQITKFNNSNNFNTLNGFLRQEKIEEFRDEKTFSTDTRIRGEVKMRERQLMSISASFAQIYKEDTTSLTQTISVRPPVLSAKENTNDVRKQVLKGTLLHSVEIGKDSKFSTGFSLFKNFFQHQGNSELNAVKSVFNNSGQKALVKGVFSPNKKFIISGEISFLRQVINNANNIELDKINSLMYNFSFTRNIGSYGRFVFMTSKEIGSVDFFRHLPYDRLQGLNKFSAGRVQGPFLLSQYRNKITYGYNNTFNNIRLSNTFERSYSPKSYEIVSSYINDGYVYFYVLGENSLRLSNNFYFDYVSDSRSHFRFKASYDDRKYKVSNVSASDVIDYNNRTLNLSLTIDQPLTDKIKISVDARYRFTELKNGGISNNFTLKSISPSLVIKVVDFIKFNSSYDFFLQNDLFGPRIFSALNAEFEFTPRGKDSPWSFILRGRNLNNFDSNQSLTVFDSDLLITSRSQELIPGYVMLLANFSF